MTTFIRVLFHLLGLLALSGGMVVFHVTKADSTSPDVLMLEGIATEEKDDRSGERLHYEKSKPFFQRWGEALCRATRGVSQGNVREQHDPTRAIGLVADLSFDDVKKQIRVICKIFDRDAIRKILAGIYSALSVGGRYIERWRDDDGVRWFVCEPSELSVCDFPALPSATFDIISKSGVERRKFAATGESMKTSDHVECAARYRKMAEHLEAHGKLCREAAGHHDKMAAQGTADGSKSAEIDFAKYANLDTPLDPAGGLRKRG